MPETLPIERREVIARRLANGHSVVAGALATEFAVSGDAIRRDLRALAAEGRCKRIYGGALPAVSIPSSIHERLAEEPARKRALARAVTSLVKQGSVIFLDGGSTNLALAEELPQDRDLTVMTNSIPIAAAILRRTGFRLILVGGGVDMDVGGCVDPHAVATVQRMVIDLCFLGACSVSVAHGVSAFDFADATFKRALVSVSLQVVVLCLTEKLETHAPHVVAALTEIDAIVVEQGTPNELRGLLVGAGLHVVAPEAR